MTTTELTDATFSVYRSIGRQTLQVSLIPTLFCAIAVLFVLRYAIPGMFTTNTPESMQGQILDSAGALALGMLVGFPLFGIGVTYMVSITVTLASDYLAGNIPDVASSVRYTSRQFGTIFRLVIRQFFFSTIGFLVSFGLTVVSALVNQGNPDQGVVGASFVALAALLGWLAGPLICLLFWFRDSLALPALICEHLTPKAASQRSHYLMRGSLGQTSGYGNLIHVYMLLFLIVLMLAVSLGTTFSLVEGFIPGFILNADLTRLLVGALPLYFGLLFVTPIWATGVTILYFERRVRLEAYDVQNLAQDVWRTNKGARFEL